MGTDSDWMGPPPDYDPSKDLAVADVWSREWHNLKGVNTCALDNAKAIIMTLRQNGAEIIEQLRAAQKVIADSLHLLEDDWEEAQNCADAEWCARSWRRLKAARALVSARLTPTPS